MTRRQEIIKILKQNTMTSSQLARHFQCTVPEIIEDLNHILQTAKAENKRLKIKPSICNSCGFIFKERQKFSRPTKCPICKSEDITEPGFFIN